MAAILKTGRLGFRGQIFRMHMSEHNRSVFRESFSRILSPLTLSIWAMGWLAASIAGPFGTFEAMAFPVRLIFWFFVTVLATLAGYFARGLAYVLVGPEKPIHFDLVAVATVVAIVTPVILIVGGAVERVAGAEVPPIHLIALFISVVAGPIFVLRRMIPGFERRRYSYQWFGDPLEGQPRILRRLPEDVRGEVLRLSANGHFTEVITTRGAHTLRLRLKDAIDETDPVAGYCTHRSHWVAEEAITRVERENGHKVFVVLINDDRVPVSRTFRPELEQLGLL